MFLSSEEEVLRTVRYVEQNPVRAGYKVQQWPFVVSYPQRYGAPQKPR